jgi:hypothetical protein
MRCRISEMHCGGGEKQAFYGEKKKKSLPNLPNIFYSVSDHYFAALITTRAVGAFNRCRLGHRRLTSIKKFIPWNLQNIKRI